MDKQQVWQQTEQRFNARSSARSSVQAALKRGNLSEANEAERLNLRLKRLGVSEPLAEAVRAGRTSFEALAVSVPPSLDVPRVQPLLGVERIMGKSDFLSVDFLYDGARAARAVGCIALQDLRRFGTGFFVSPRLLLTNNHVLETAHQAASCVVLLDYRAEVTTDELQRTAFKLRPDQFFITDIALDFTLVAVEEQSLQGLPRTETGWLPLTAEQGTILVGEFMNIVQHPNGEPKQVALRENALQDILDDFVHYQSDTSPGSSGSPVFNDQWEVVALHHSGVPRRDKQGQPLTRDGQPWKPGQPDHWIDWIANEGVRISRILAKVQQSPLPPEQEQLRQELLRGGAATTGQTVMPAPAYAPPTSPASPPSYMSQPEVLRSVSNTEQPLGTGASAPPSGGESSWNTFSHTPFNESANPFVRDTLRRGTLIYIHGVGNHPPEAQLKRQWDTALFGQDIGERSRMAYWVDRDRYPTAETPDVEERWGGELGVAFHEAGAARPLDVAAMLPPEASLEARQMFERLAQQMQAEAAQEPAPREAGYGVEAIPLPRPARQWLARRFARQFFPDAHDYMFVPEARRRMRESLLARLRVGGGPFVIIGHSLGSVIAYDVLRELSPSQCDVRALITIGTPLGVREIQDRLRQWPPGTLETPACVGKWLNVADRLDPIALDPAIDNDFGGQPIQDVVGIGVNRDGWRNPHSSRGYLRVPEVRQTVSDTLGADFGQPIGSFVLARDLVAESNTVPQARHPILVELSAVEGGSQDVNQRREAVVAELRSLVGPQAESNAGIDVLRRFVAARLTRAELEQLAVRCPGLPIRHVWRNLPKRALVHESAAQVKAPAARQSFGAAGKEIGWAVLDTGIRADHPHFQPRQNIVNQWDCTHVGPPRNGAPDGHGHGTHVAGIIAGESPQELREPRPGGTSQPVKITGIAPDAKLHIYKVLEDDGYGQDSYIIKALDHIAEVNESADGLVVHGVNLSLGGSFDPATYGCGHSPLCRELYRLWRQGVLVCIAAGNEGFAQINTSLGVLDTNRDLSIADPANLEEAIAVGSVHRGRHTTYGVSYFSSRGPTADGRGKPDVVAPGERIWSARHSFQTMGQDLEDWYVAFSGTSMACPHVSGVLAAFLSARREFIGLPDNVKEILLEHCTTIGRDPFVQGHGLPNLMKMLQET